MEKNKTQRLIQIFWHLLKKPNSWMTTREIHKKLELNESQFRSVQRDLRDLEDYLKSYPCALQTQGTGPHTKWRLTDSNEGVFNELDSDKVLNLIVLKRFLSHFPELRLELGDVFQGYLRGISKNAKKLYEESERSLAGKIVFLGSQLSQPKFSGSHLEMVLRAIKEKRKIETLYFGNLYHDPILSKRIPTSLFFHNNHVYIGCFSQSNPKAEYLLKLDRILEVKLLGECYEEQPHRLLRLKQRLKNKGGLLQDESETLERVVLEFPYYFHNVLRENSYHSSASYKVNGETLELEMVIQVNRSLFQWVLQWADRVTVVEPPSLKEKLRVFGEGLSKKYG